MKKKFSINKNENYISVDIDNTVADQDTRFRRYFNKEKNIIDPKVFDKEIMLQDKPIEGSVETIKKLNQHFKIAWVSARKETFLNITIKWLEKNDFPIDDIFLVNQNDNKIEILKELKPIFHIDDMKYNWERLNPKPCNNFMRALEKLEIPFIIFENNWGNILNIVKSITNISNQNKNISFGYESGSGTQTNVIVVNRVLKEATQERMEKLVDEINFIESLPDKLKPNFPKIIKSNKESKDKVYYEMQHYNLPTLRRLIIAKKVSEEELNSWNEILVKFCRDLYSIDKINAPNNYVETMHLDRMQRRLLELKTKSKIHKKMLEAEKIIIEDKDYESLYHLINKIKIIIKRNPVNPESIGKWGHADMHYSNVLVNTKTKEFILIDPRGYDYCDYFYDLGKIWHSLNGKYEMISSRLIRSSKTTKGNNDHYTFIIDQKETIELLEKTKKPFEKLVLNTFNHSFTNDNFMRIVKFNEMCHFISLLPFLLEFDQIENRSVTAHLTAIKIAQNWCEEYK